MGRASAIGIDTGGTFTDLVQIRAGRRYVTKVPSTPDDPSRAVLAALDAAGGLEEGGRLHHGSTVGTNTVLTNTGADVAFVTTAGFEDLLHVGRGQRDDLHALQPRRTPPLVVRASCIGVDERMGADGNVVHPLSDRAITRAVRAVRKSGAEAVAVCLLHAPRAPRHERRLARALAKALRADGVGVHASADLSADGREAERAATTVLDAYIGPVVARYVRRIARALPSGALTIMRSDGGRMSASEVRRAPVRTLLSGPAAGVAAAHALARRLDLERALSFDVGGTSTDVAWLAGDDLEVQGELVIGPHRASVPSLALETVGAGGGSVVWLDDGGALQVGPASAGAAPGPACYGHGGPFTLTDAWLLLDRLPTALLDGGFALDAKAARAAARPLAGAAGMTVRALALGAVRVAAVTTARALRRASVARGHDPQGAALIAFGGAGPMLAAETAEHLDLALVVLPPDPGTFAAEGTLLAPLRADASRVVTRPDMTSLRRVEASLRREVQNRLEAQEARHTRLVVEVEARYAGQAFEVCVPFGRVWEAQFHAEHARRYGFADDRREVEIVRLRVRGSGLERPPRRRASRTGARVRGRTIRGERSMARGDLKPNDRVVGPARIEEHTATTYVPRGWVARRTEHADLILERDA